MTAASTSPARPPHVPDATGNEASERILRRAVTSLRRASAGSRSHEGRLPADHHHPRGDRMTGWDNSNRKHELPRDWHRRRAIVLRRDKTCRCKDCDLHAGPCLELSTDVDHITDRARHDVNGLQGLCNPCHERKTIRDRETKRAERAASRRRPAEAHPGLIPR